MKNKDITYNVGDELLCVKNNKVFIGNMFNGTYKSVLNLVEGEIYTIIHIEDKFPIASNKKVPFVSIIDELGETFEFTINSIMMNRYFKYLGESIENSNIEEWYEEF